MEDKQLYVRASGPLTKGSLQFDELTEARQAVKDLAEVLDIWYSEYSNNETCTEGKQIKDVLTTHANAINKARGI